MKFFADHRYDDIVRRHETETETEIAATYATDMHTNIVVPDRTAHE